MTNIKHLSISYVCSLKEEIEKIIATKKPFTLDLSGLESFDFSGIQFLVALVKECEAKDIEIQLVGDINSAIQNSIQLSGLTNYLCEE